MTRYCCVCRIEQSQRNPHVTFHRFPSDPDVLRKWLEVLKQENAKGRICCSRHFKPEDYRELCDKLLLKRDAIPSLNIPVPSTENNEQNSKLFIKESYKETEDINENTNKNVQREYASVSADSIKNLKRKNNSCKQTVPEKKRCSLKTFGIFRREDFLDQTKWNRFVTACQNLKKENLLLQRKNKRLNKKIETFNDVISDLLSN